MRANTEGGVFRAIPVATLLGAILGLAAVTAGLLLGCSLLGSASIPVADIEQKIAEADTNHDGQLSAAELVELVKSLRK